MNRYDISTVSYNSDDILFRNSLTSSKGSLKRQLTRLISTPRNIFLALVNPYKLIGYIWLSSENSTAVALLYPCLIRHWNDDEYTKSSFDIRTESKQFTEERAKM